MLGPNSRFPAALALVGCLLGLLFAANSTLDYADHLDRRLHDIHCSFVPGASVTEEGEACRAAMYSPYGAVLRDSTWGGLPVGLFALGAYAFFTAFAVYLLVAAARAPSKAILFFSAVSLTPLLVSVLMLTVSIVELGTLCKTCVGLYIASLLLALGGLLGLATLRHSPELFGKPPRPRASGAWAVLWLACLGFLTLLPSAVYAAGAPDHTPYLTQCGQIKDSGASDSALIHFQSPSSVQPALLFEDPLCATCKAFHERLASEGILSKLNATLALFPLDNECNWMLDRPLHPGACLVSRAILCGGAQTHDVLEWAYDEQEYLLRAGKAGEGTLRAVIQNRWGPAIAQCADSRETKTRLNQHLHFAATNSIPVSTPQLYLGKQRICDEDTDIGLRFTLMKLAPEVLK